MLKFLAPSFSWWWVEFLLLCALWWVRVKGRPHETPSVSALCNIQGKVPSGSYLFYRYSGHSQAESDITTSSSHAHPELRKQTHTHTLLWVHSRGNSGPVQSSWHLSCCAPQAQAALSSAVGLTMPQRTHHPLIHVLLLWLTVLSVVQIVFVVLFFTDGHHGLVRVLQNILRLNWKYFMCLKYEC